MDEQTPDPVLVKYPFLAIAKGDDAATRSSKTFWHLAMSLPKEERKVYLQEDRVRSEEYWLDYMVRSMEEDAVTIANAVAEAKQLVKFAEACGNPEDADYSYQRAELWASIAQSTKAARYTIKDIRKQRERVQWEKQKLNQMKSKLSENNTASNPS